MNTDRLRMWAACRPVLGLFVRGRPIPFPPRYYYVIRHGRFALYLARPYDPTGHPRRDWQPLDRAWRFATRESADDMATEYAGHVEQHQLNGD